MAKKIFKKVSQKPDIEATKYLDKVPDEYVFWVSDGRVLKDMKEMAEALSSMSEETFASHVNASKNDFFNWVRDIIKDDTLAKDIEKVLSRADAARIVEKRVVFLSNLPK